MCIRDRLDNHRELNDLCHKMDSTRLTTLACYAMCGPFNPVAHITDLVSWNLYLGWYVPGLFLNDLWMDFFHLVYPGRPLGFSEYGAEGMPNPVSYTHLISSTRSSSSSAAASAHSRSC